LILVWGAGAIGGTVGAYLARAGHEVLFVDVDADHVAVINTSGLSIDGPIDNFNVPARAVLPEQVEGVFDSILLCVKAQHTQNASAQLAPHLTADGYVVSLQNGLNEYVIAEVVGMARVIGAFVNFGADYLAPGRITYSGRGAVVLGEMDGSVPKRLQALVELMRDFEPDAVATPDILGYLWGKLGYGALLFGTALTDDSIVDVLDDPRHRAVLAALGAEVVAVADKRGIISRGFNGFDPAAFRAGADPTASFDAMVAFNRRSAKTHSGIWRDLAVRHRTTEVDMQLGAVADAARESDLTAPLVARVTEMIHQIERGERRLSRENLDELAA